jgi:hypothetical protein
MERNFATALLKAALSVPGGGNGSSALPLGLNPKQLTPNLVFGSKYPPFTPGRPHPVRLIVSGSA